MAALEEGDAVGAAMREMEAALEEERYGGEWAGSTGGGGGGAGAGGRQGGCARACAASLRVCTSQWMLSIALMPCAASHACHVLPHWRLPHAEQGAGSGRPCARTSLPSSPPPPPPPPPFSSPPSYPQTQRACATAPAWGWWGGGWGAALTRWTLGRTLPGGWVGGGWVGGHGFALLLALLCSCPPPPTTTTHTPHCPTLPQPSRPHPVCVCCRVVPDFGRYAVQAYTAKDLFELLVSGGGRARVCACVRAAAAGALKACVLAARWEARACAHRPRPLCAALADLCPPPTPSPPPAAAEPGSIHRRGCFGEGAL